MTNEKAIQWLTMQKEKPVRWDDYSEESRAIREAAEMQMKQAFDMAIYALKAQEPMLVVSKDTNEIIGDCPRCGRHVIHWHNKYCAECGQAVKWE